MRGGDATKGEMPKRAAKAKTFLLPLPLDRICLSGLAILPLVGWGFWDVRDLAMPWSAALLIASLPLAISGAHFAMMGLYRSLPREREVRLTEKALEFPKEVNASISLPIKSIEVEGFGTRKTILMTGPVGEAEVSASSTCHSLRGIFAELQAFFDSGEALDYDAVKGILESRLSKRPQTF